METTEQCVKIFPPPCCINVWLDKGTEGSDGIFRINPSDILTVSENLNVKL